MEIKFCKYFKTENRDNLDLFSIIVNNDNEFVTMSCDLSDTMIATNRDSCEAVDKYLHSFNSGINNIERLPFEDFVLKDCTNLDYTYRSYFKELIRIIGITNGIGHYCTKFSKPEVTDTFLLNCINERVAGFVFLDWNEISEDDDTNSNQIIYVTSSDIEEIYKLELQEAFNTGKIGRIELPPFNKQKDTVHYFATTSDLDTKFTKTDKLRNKIVNIVNSNLMSRFGV